MKRAALFAIPVLLVFSGALNGQIPQPTITSISPDQTTAGAASFILAVTGTNFMAGGVSVVRWNGSPLPTSFVSSTQLQATVSSSLLTSPGTALVNVVNSGVLQSPTSLSFTINPPLVITTTSLNPMTVAVPFSQTLQLSGGTPPYLWSAPPGALPPLLSLTTSGFIGGTPIAASSGFAQISVSDSAGAAASRVFNWTVNPAVLTITNTSPLLNATAGTFYSQTTFAVTGGFSPYAWSIISGSLPPGLSLCTTTSQTCPLRGIPTQTGTFNFTVRVGDSSSGSTSKAFSLTVDISQPVISPDVLPDATAGEAYSQTFSAAQYVGGTTWSLQTGSLPSGLSLSSAGVLSGTPLQKGTFSFRVRVTDGIGGIGGKSFKLLVSQASLAITTASPLPGGAAGTAYSVTFAAAGGVPPIAWSLQSGSLPTGLSLSTDGKLSGTPTQGGTFNFTVRAADNPSSGVSTSKAFSLTLSVPQAPTVSITGLTDTVNPAQQPVLDVQLSSPYTLPITGTITLTFAHNAVNPSDDPSIQFSTGGRTLNFTIPAGQTSASWPSSHAVQTGTVAGRIDLTLSFFAGGLNITPTPAPVRPMTISRAAPQISSVQVARTSGGFNVVVRGYSTPRQVTQATFNFTAAQGGNLQTTVVTVPVDSAFTTWYTGTTSTQFGSSFLYTQPFTVQGNTNDIASVSVTLTNATGTSTAVSASF